MESTPRFGDIGEEELNNLLENRDSLSTKNVIKGAVNVLRKYCQEKIIQFPTERTTCTNEELNTLLTRFYTSARTKQGELYSKKSMLSIRYGLQKCFENELNVDIVNSNDFTLANKLFQAMLVKLKKEGKAKVQHKYPLTKEDLCKLYDSFDMDTPNGLQNKVFVDFMIYFCNRGRENLRIVKKCDFIFNEKQHFIEMKDMATKNHKGGINDGDSQGGRIYQTGLDLCPYASFKKYLSVLHPGTETFFQRPRLTAASIPWYDNMVLGKNTLGNIMKTLSTQANLSRMYTNHCLRATSITLLDGFEARHVMTISGHKSESSIRSYARTSDDQKEKMALTIAESISGTSVPVKTATIDTEIDKWDMTDMDLLQLTSSQEMRLLGEIQNDNNAASSQDISHFKTVETYQGTTNTTEYVQRSNYTAPIYNFHNSVVHIHHH